MLKELRVRWREIALILRGIRLSALVHSRHKTAARSRWLGLLCSNSSTRLASLVRQSLYSSKLADELSPDTLLPLGCSQFLFSTALLRPQNCCLEPDNLLLEFLRMDAHFRQSVQPTTCFFCTIPFVDPPRLGTAAD